MSLIEQITADMIAAQKAGQAPKLAALRYLRAGLLARAKDLRQETLDDTETQAVIQKEIKKHRDSITAFTAGNRPELAAAEQAELDIISAYMPPSLTESEIEQIIETVIAAQNLTPPYDFGRLMGPVMKEIGSRADGNLVKSLIQKKIAG
jgi:uncharacterized protein YqeY